jgi:hypothetical protein
VSVPVCIESAGIAVVVSIGAGVASGAGVVVIAVLSVVFSSVLLVSPQEATKRPIERAKIPNFTNFIIVFLNGYFTFIPYSGKGNPTKKKKVRLFSKKPAMAPF